jgi:hypothetical protein
MLLNLNEIGHRYNINFENLKQRLSYTSNFQKWWSEDFKRSTMNFYKGEIIFFNRECTRRKDFFYGLLRELASQQNNGEATDADIGYVKRELCNIERQKLDALGFKMKSHVICEDERLNLHHFAKQKNEKITLKCCK